MTKTVVATVLAVLLAAACSSIDHGMVIGKEYDDPDTWTTNEPVYMQQCHTVMRYRTSYVNGKPVTNYVPEQQCQQQIAYWHDVQHYDGPHWRLRLRDGDDEGWKGVTEQEYGDYKTGEQYPRVEANG